MYALKLADDGRILAIMDPRYQTAQTPLVEDYPQEIKDGYSHDYRYVDGQWVYDPVPRAKDAGNIFDVVDSLLLGKVKMDKLKAAEQMRRALQLFAASLTDEQAMEVAAVYDPWEVGKAYAAGDFLAYGVNGVGDPQLYKVAQAHTAQADWMPDVTPALYAPIGLDAAGYPVWSQPAGAHDAYNTGDIVNYNGTLYQSLIAGNTTLPGTDDRYWAAYQGGTV